MITFKGKSWLDILGVKRAVDEAKIKPLQRCALSVERRAKIITSKGGRSRGAKGPRGGKGKLSSVASRVGQPPHKQTGALSNSISWVFTNRGTALVGPTTVAWYGRIHEFSNKFPRPFMRPALDYERPSFPGYFRNMKLSQTQAGRGLNRGDGRKRARRKL